MANQKKKLSAFGQAVISQSVSAEIEVEDVLGAAPWMSRELAGRWLVHHQDAIGHAMVLAGVNELVRQLRASNDN